MALKIPKTVQEMDIEIEESKWINDISGCDSIIKGDWWMGDDITVYCYASKPEYNHALKKLKDEKYIHSLITYNSSKYSRKRSYVLSDYPLMIVTS